MHGIYLLVLLVITILTITPNLFVWGQKISGVPSTNYKVSATVPFAFKQGTITPPANIIKEQRCNVYPNPARTEVILSNGTGSNTANNYQIIDITGAKIFEGYIDGEKAQIDLSKIATGSYFIKMFNDDKLIDNLRFVKD